MQKFSTMVQTWDWGRLLETAWFASIQPALGRAPWPRRSWPSLADYQALFDGLPAPPRSGSGAPLRVVAQQATSAAGYETRIFARGELPTRSENWHDCFNVLAWASFPRAKSALNARHHAALAQAPARGRSPEQDALTQFDESGVVVMASNRALLELIRSFSWKALFWQRRAQLATSLACYLFGHGLMEKALRPYVGLTGKAILFAVDPAFFQEPLPARLREVDARLAAWLADGSHLQTPRDLAPLPLLGLPGFSALGEAEAFYDRVDYFRPGRRAG